MKKSTPWAEHHNDAEREIRADERNKVLASEDKDRRKIYALASEIMKLSAGFAPATEVAEPSPTDFDAKPASKRKATTADQAQIDEALRILRIIKPPGEAITPKQLTEAWLAGFGGLKIAGAALRALVEQGKAIEVKRGKFKAVELSANSETHDDVE